MGHLLTNPEGAADCLKLLSDKVVFDVLQRPEAQLERHNLEIQLFFQRIFLFSYPWR